MVMVSYLDPPSSSRWYFHRLEKHIRTGIKICGILCYWYGRFDLVGGTICKGNSLRRDPPGRLRGAQVGPGTTPQ